MTEPLLIIDEVEVMVEGDNPIENVDIDGSDDIFEHPEVRRLVNEKDGKIRKIKGEMIYTRNTKFDFQAGFTSDQSFGRLKVSKKGQRTGDAQIVDDAFDFLYEIYEEYFIDIN
jgi:hypothetical protein